MNCNDHSSLSKLRLDFLTWVRNHHFVPTSHQTWIQNRLFVPTLSIVLPQLTDEVATLAARVDEHLKKMGAVWK